MNLTPDQLDTLRHMLGIDTPDDRVPNPYRDYYCAAAGDVKLAELERMGAVKCTRRAGLPGVFSEYDNYVTTPAGRAAAIASHRTIRRTKAQRVYSKFLDVSDCFADLTFREFLTGPEFAQTRREA